MLSSDKLITITYLFQETSCCTLVMNMHTLGGKFISLMDVGLQSLAFDLASTILLLPIVSALFADYLKFPLACYLLQLRRVQISRHRCAFSLLEIIIKPLQRRELRIFQKIAAVKVVCKLQQGK